MAREDLRSIVQYMGKDSVARARSFGNELRDKTLQLSQYPESGRTGRPALPENVRELVVHRNYIVFYRVLDDTHVVEILRVRHVAQQTP